MVSSAQCLNCSDVETNDHVFTPCVVVKTYWYLDSQYLAIARRSLRTSRRRAPRSRFSRLVLTALEKLVFAMGRHQRIRPMLYLLARLEELF